jgi:hypothetical protein
MAGEDVDPVAPLAGRQGPDSDHVQVAGAILGDRVEVLREVGARVGVDGVRHEARRAGAAALGHGDVEVAQRRTDRGGGDVRAVGLGHPHVHRAVLRVDNRLGDEVSTRGGHEVGQTRTTAEDVAARRERRAVVGGAVDERDVRGEVVVGEVLLAVRSVVEPLPVVVRSGLAGGDARAARIDRRGVAERLAPVGAAADRRRRGLEVGDVDRVVARHVDVAVAAARPRADVGGDREAAPVVMAGPEADALVREADETAHSCRDALRRHDVDRAVAGWVERHARLPTRPVPQLLRRRPHRDPRGAGVRGRHRRHGTGEDDRAGCQEADGST